VDHLVNNAGIAHSFFFTDTKDLQALTSTFVRFETPPLMDEVLLISKLNLLATSCSVGDLEIHLLRIY
jgi:hypothetical protein